MSGDGLRPASLVVVTGTGTEVGKTWVSSHVLRELRAEGYAVAARKPAQSFDPADRTTDAHLLAAATDEDPVDVCPRHRWYPVAMAPPMAADSLGRPPFSVVDLVEETMWPVPRPDLGLVEAAGGLRSPQADDGDALRLVEELQPDLVVVVADAGLGTINAVSLTLEALDRGAHVATPIVHLNRFDPADELHRRNRAWMAGHLDVEIVASVPVLVGRLRPPRS